MAITQVKYGTPDGGYCVVDNGAPGDIGNQNGIYPNNTTIAGAGGYDNTYGGAGAAGQGVNTYSNGTIPGFLATGTTTVLNNPMSATILFKNPA